MYWYHDRGVYTMVEAGTMRVRDREKEKTPTELSSLNWVTERTAVLDKFPSTIQAFFHVSKQLNSASFTPVHTKQSHVIL